MRILVAEDSSTNQAVMRAMLGKLGHCFDIVGDGAGAVAAARRVAYDLVLMDLLMPGIDGVEATRSIREQTDMCCDVPIVALTADMSDAVAARFAVAGVEFVLRKPVTMAALERCFAEVAAGRGKGPRAASSAAQPQNPAPN